MASFTDQLIGFNPYIQQIPVDDYVRVGMIKQQQYNQGVEKVQGYIDSVAGLEVIKPEQKSYLQQRVNNLQQEVGRVVQADFSNQQLVNSVGALTNKIASDPIVQTSVASTQAYKTGLAEMKEAKEKGKSSVSNEWDFSNQFQKWYNDGDATTRFTGSYTPYTDVTSKISKIIKDLEPNSQIEDNPFKRGARGEILLDKDGLPQIDFAMIERGSKTLTPERIRMAIQANMDSNDMNQLRIDGRYSYRGQDANGMKSITDQTYQYKLDQMNDVIQGLMVQRATVNNDPQEAARIDAQIQVYKDRAVSYQNSYRQDISSINSNLEGYKGNMYTNNWLTRFGDGYAYAQNSLTYKENPYFMAAERRRENDIKFQEFIVDRQFKAAQIGIEEEKLGLEREKLEAYKLSLQVKASKTAKGSLDGIPLSDAVLEPIPGGGLDEVNLSSFLKETQDIGNDIDQQKMALLGNTGLVITKRDRDGKNPHYEYNVEGKDPNTVINSANAAVAKLKDAYDRDPNSVDQGARTYFQNLANADQVIQNRKFAAAKVGEEADRDGFSLKSIIGKLPNLRVVTNTGDTYYMTGQEQFDFNNKIHAATESYPAYGGPGGIGLDDEKARSLMNTPAEKYMYNIVKKHMKGAPLTPQEAQIITKLGDVNRNANTTSFSLQRGRSKYMDNAVKDLVGVQQPVSFTLEAFKAEDRNRAKAVASNIVASMSREDKGSPGEYFDRANAASMLQKKNDDNTNYSLFSQGREKYSLRMTNEDVSKEGIDIPLTKAQAEELFGQGQFLDDFYNIRQSLQLTKGTAKWTTDVRGLGRDGAFNLQSGLLNKYSVKYHVEDPLKNGGLQVRLYIYDKQNKQWLPEKTANFGQLLNEAQVTKFLSQMGDQYIDATLQSNK